MKLQYLWLLIVKIVLFWLALFFIESQSVTDTPTKTHKRLCNS